MACTILLGNTGNACNEYEGFVKAAIFSSSKKEFATIADAELLANWQSFLFATNNTARGFYVRADILEVTQDEAVYAPESTGKTPSEILYTKAGQIKLKLNNANAYQIKNMLFESNSSRKLHVFLITSQNKIEGLTNSTGTKFISREFTVSKMVTKADGATPKYIILDLVAENTNDENRLAVLTPDDFSPISDLYGIKDMSATVVGVPTASEIILTITDKASGSLSPEDLVAADFVVKDDTGAVIPTVDITLTNTANIYKFTSVALFTDPTTFQFSATGLAKGYEFPTPISVTV